MLKLKVYATPAVLAAVSVCAAMGGAFRKS